MFGWLKKFFGSAQDRLLRKYFKLVTQVNEWDEKYKALSDEKLRMKTQEFRERLEKGENLDQLLPEAYGVVKNVCRRMWGTDVHVSGYNQQWDMIPYDVQIVGGIAMHFGSITEMHTGEGKTLTATLPLYLNALTGKPVHLVTVNDYLAQRDCEWTGSILRWLGLTTGALTAETPTHFRQQLYQCDVVYGTASEFGFDYLRDNSMASRKEDQVQRGYFFAIIDEVDSILIDEARTPLIISGPVPVSRQMYDELKGGVEELVRRQRDYCNRLATDSKKVLEQLEAIDKSKRTKAHNQSEQESLRKFWLVSKGTPRNKILKRVKEEPDYRAAIDKWDLYYYNDQNKEEKHKALADLYMIIDEKANEYELTDKGISAWHECTNGIGQSDDFIMLDISYEYTLIDQDASLNADEKMQRKLSVQEEDQKRKERAHNLRQLLRGHLLMEKDVDYMVQEGKIIIIDENTGRAQPGRRFSDGLHQAIEAKEGVEVQKETQTYATITLQNYFRMYAKLAGMTGTAVTEANEFKQIYKLDVLEIPTHRKSQRTDFNDEIYMTEREKYNAILKEVSEIHAKGRPILIGTESVDVSEKLSRIFKINKLPHSVLNAKQHEQEAEVVANAGKKFSITISTNMAGRGTDIKLEKGVADLGGLYVMGTTRHQSRRIDRQLRGRCARQGDPGTSKFYVSFEDSLMRLFSSPRITGLLQRFRPPEGEPISAGMLNKSIETAQKRLEQRNSMIRKHTLEYDDVMNKQRQEVYAFRNDVLHSNNLVPLAIELLNDVCAFGAEKYFRNRSEDEGWDPEGYRQWLMRHFPISFPERAFDQDNMDAEEIYQLAAEKVMGAFNEKVQHEEGKFDQLRAVGIAPQGSPTQNILRHLMIRKSDHLWIDHLLAMDHLRMDVNLRAVGQRDPLMEFKHEAFAMFDEFSHRLRTDIGQDLFRFEVAVPSSTDLERLMSQIQLERNRSLVADLEQAPPPPAQDSQEPDEEPPSSNPIVSAPKVGRNDDCPCGSGKKYKKCCGSREPDEAPV